MHGAYNMHKTVYFVAYSLAKIQTKLFRTFVKCHSMPQANEPIHFQYSISGISNSWNIRQENKISIF